jgi:hypothetical protein
MHRRKTFVVSIALVLLAAPGVAFAEESPAPRADAYGYVFPDDPLDAGFFGLNDVHIRVIPKPKRITLIRPRTQFVVEMLKSVEGI